MLLVRSSQGIGSIPVLWSEERVYNAPLLAGNYVIGEYVQYIAHTLNALTPWCTYGEGRDDPTAGDH